ncbi:DUF4349 domain-containing protein [Candidatus Gracilibacteria bacterium]|nr:DUF4349 domain-containing protein [Candidatus Gracilibacteria bacterium]
MAQKESLWFRLNHFVQGHLLLIILLVLAGWWIWEQNPRPVFRGESMSYDTDGAMEEMAMAPKMMYSRATGANYGGSIMPQMDNNFIPDAEDRKIIKNGSLDMEVTDTEEARMQAENIIEEEGGAITNLNSWETRPGILAYNFTLRVPSEKLEDIVVRLTELGIKKSESFNISDITAQYQDTENRLENLRARRDRLREMMGRETDKLADILAIDRELANVQNEIENLERSQNRRDTDVAYSTLNLTLRPEPQIGDVQDPHWNAKKSWRMAVNDFLTSSQHITDKLIKAVVYAPIWIPILLILWWVDRKFLRRRK